MDCKKVEIHLADYFYKDLSEEHKGLIQDHLHHCPSCQALYHKMSAVLNASAVSSEMQAPAFIETRILARLDNQPKHAARILQYVLRPAAVLSLTVFGIWIGIKISNTFQTGNTDVFISNENNTTLATQFASENYLTTPSDQFIDMYLNNNNE